MSCDPKEITAAFQTIPWFQEITPEHFDKLCEISCLREVEPGEELFREGDKEDYLYIVLEGRVAIEIYVPARGRMRIYTAEALDIVGWSSATPVVRQRTASARAVLPSRLIAMDAQKLRQLCEEDYHLGYVVMRRLANVVASRLLVTRLQLLDIFAHPGGEAKNE
ncbi:MAG: Crp/Fnr family transcriptional regulator [Chloroflexi bacterium]|nr:Crp/Fnr family transcriptional regulator [Chloroflexota bacterium]